MPDDVIVTYSSPSPTSINSLSPNSPSLINLNEYEIKTDIRSDLPFHSKKKLIQFKPTHHDIFHSSNLNGPTFKQIILVFLMFVVVTSLCSYLYKDSLVNVLLILETLPWWTTFLFFCVLFTIVSLPFAWGKYQTYLLHFQTHFSFFRLYFIKYSMWFSLWTCLWCDIYNNLC